LGHKWHIWSEIPLVTLDNLHKYFVAKDIMWHQIETTIASMCNLHPFHPIDI
jgi:hypothetical protein